MFSDPRRNIEQFNLAHGARVADVGSGSGFYALAAAEAVSPLGRVYAVDVQKELLEKLKNEALRRHLLNIEVIWGDAETPGGTRLADASVDAALVCNILFQIERKDGLALEAKRILKPGGRALVVDWLDSFRGMGPSPEHIVPASEAKKIFEQAGLAFERELRAGEHHYGLVFRKN